MARYHTILLLLLFSLLTLSALASPTNKNNAASLQRRQATRSSVIKAQLRRAASPVRRQSPSDIPSDLFNRNFHIRNPTDAAYGTASGLYFATSDETRRIQSSAVDPITASIYVLTSGGTLQQVIDGAPETHDAYYATGQEGGIDLMVATPNQIQGFPGYALLPCTINPRTLVISCGPSDRRIGSLSPTRADAALVLTRSPGSVQGVVVEFV